jgi:acetyl esterase/lipase
VEGKSTASLADLSRRLKPLAPVAITANALRPLSRNNPAAAYAFALGWHVSELPLLALGLQLTKTTLAVRGGRWKTPSGQARLAAQAVSAAGLLTLHRGAQQSKQVLESALEDGLGSDYRDRATVAGIAPADSPVIRPWAPFPTYIGGRSRLRAKGVVYGPDPTRNRLDVWAKPELQPGSRAPVLVQIPGGGWVYGDSRHQAYPLMDRLRDAGWVCVPISYRLSPKATFPDHIVDVKQALAWVKRHIADYGGDPDFVVITGGSAGGHLSSLAALTPNEPEFQPGFEDADTSVQAAVPFYGIYDLADWNGRGGPAYSIRHVRKSVLKAAPDAEPELWRRASPISWVGPDAPPMMILHGINDSLVPVEGARRMARELRAASRRPVVYAELPYAQHAFDIYGSLRTLHTVRAVEWFLAYVRGERLLAGQLAGADATRS